jgi:bacillithiol biosynthesis deacetylase BshB1
LNRFRGMSDPAPVDVLAIAAHRDDVEQTCGGTLLAHAFAATAHGNSRPDPGGGRHPRFSGERAREAEEAARILCVAWRGALDIPDGRVENTWENRIKIVRKLRQLRPRVVILPYWQGRHPDHYNSSTLGYEACFLSGLAKIETGEPPFRPFKIVYASLYADVRPSFVVDITPFIEERFRALLAYRSQYTDQPSGGSLFVPHDEIRERTFSLARHYGLLGGVRYAEPFVQKEVGLVDDLTLLPVASI